MKDPRIEKVKHLVNTLENASAHLKFEGSFVTIRGRDWQAILTATEKVLDVL